MTTLLRDDYGAAGLRAAARKTKDAGQARRLLALAVDRRGILTPFWSAPLRVDSVGDLN
jgi:hypothetical protein